MAISIYDPRSMERALEEMKPARAFLRSLFFGGPPQTRLTENIDVPIRTASRRAAEFSNRNGAGKAVDRQGFTIYTFKTPNVAPKMSITVPDMQTITPGEHIYGGESPDSRAAKLLGGDLETLEEMISRREELMARDALINGSIVADGDDVAQTITFPARHASLTKGLLAAGDRWGAATSDPIGDLEDWGEAINAQSGLSADVILMGLDAWKAFRMNDAVTAALDNRRMVMGELTQRTTLTNSGAKFKGVIGDVEIWTYSERDASGDPLIAAKTVLMGSTSSDCRMYYGGVGVASGEGNSARISLVAGRRVPESWVEKDPAVRWLKVSSRPLPVPVEINGFLTATVLA